MADADKAKAKNVFGVCRKQYNSTAQG